MRIAISDNQRRLSEIIEPYFVYENGGYVKHDAPSEVHDAYKELLELGKMQREDIVKSFQ